MHFIAHRGNVEGRNPALENTPWYILAAIQKGFDCEIDVWYTNGAVFLGHDAPDRQVELSFLDDLKHNLWIHCKNLEALVFLSQLPGFNCFFHDKDVYTVTTRRAIWGNVNSPINGNVICVMPELYTVPVNPMLARGICSDTVGTYRTTYQNMRGQL